MTARGDVSAPAPASGPPSVPAPVPGAALRAVVDAVTGLAGEVFATVDTLRDTAEGLLAVRRDVTLRDLAPLEAPARGALERAGGAMAGAGFVAEPGLLHGAGHWLEWWTVDDDHARAVRLLVETDTGADGFRDYTVLPWFDVPRRTGRPHVTGPYVDYLCSDEYMLTFTSPVAGPAGFAGVVGADVPVRQVERLLVPLLRAVPVPAALVNAGGRVVVGNRPDLVVGSLVRDVPVAALWPHGSAPDATAPAAVHRCADLPLAILIRARP